MNLTSSHPFWPVNNGLPENYPALQRDATRDAVVVGGGITGAVVAVHLVEAGVKTLLIDKRDIGTGSTRRERHHLQPPRRRDHPGLFHRQENSRRLHLPLRPLMERAAFAAIDKGQKKSQNSIGQL